MEIPGQFFYAGIGVAVAGGAPKIGPGSAYSARLGIYSLCYGAAIVGLFALLYEGSTPSLDNFFSKMFLSDAGSFSLASLVVGFLLAWCAYAISVITVPMLVDRQVDGFTAIRFIIKSVLGNMPAMMLWAGLIILKVGLVIALPLIGHASWHAYRDLVLAGE